MRSENETTPKKPDPGFAIEVVKYLDEINNKFPKALYWFANDALGNHTFEQRVFFDLVPPDKEKISNEDAMQEACRKNQFLLKDLETSITSIDRLYEMKNALATKDAVIHCFNDYVGNTNEWKEFWDDTVCNNENISEEDREPLKNKIMGAVAYSEVTPMSRPAIKKFLGRSNPLYN